MCNPVVFLDKAVKFARGDNAHLMMSGKDA